MTLLTTVGKGPARAVLATCTIALAATACGSSSSSSLSPGASTVPGGASTATSGSTAPKGSPVKIMVESSVNSPIGSFPGDWGGAEAAAAAINRSGGVGGHPVSVELCNSVFSVNNAVACARKAVADKVVAYTGFTPFAFAIEPILKPAGILLSSWISSLADAQNPSILPVDGGGDELEQTAEPLAAEAAGAKTAAIALTDYPGLGPTIAAQEQGLTKLGIRLVKVVHLSVTQTDTTAAVEQLAQAKPGAVVLDLTAAQEASVLQTAQSTGFHPAWVSNAAAFGVSSVKDFAQLTNNLRIVSVTPVFQSSSSTNAAYKQFNSEMSAAAKAGVSDAAAGNRDDSTFYVWATTHALASVAGTITGPVTSTSFSAAIAGTKDLNVVNLWQWTPTASGGKLLPHVTGGGQVFLGTLGSGGTFDIQERVPALTMLGLG